MKEVHVTINVQPHEPISHGNLDAVDELDAIDKLFLRLRWIKSMKLIPN